MQRSNVLGFRVKRSKQTRNTSTLPGQSKSTPLQSISNKKWPKSKDRSTPPPMPVTMQGSSWIIDLEPVIFDLEQPMKRKREEAVCCADELLNSGPPTPPQILNGPPGSWVRSWVVGNELEPVEIKQTKRRHKEAVRPEKPLAVNVLPRLMIGNS